MRDEEGLGVGAWCALEEFVRAKSKAVVSTLSQCSVGDKPGEQDVLARWEEAEKIASLHRRVRSVDAAVKADKGHRRAMQNVCSQPVDPDILAYLLSGMISHRQDPERWDAEVETLAMDPEPYKDNADLEAHCNAFLQLASIVPCDQLQSCTAQVCQTISNASSHNSFGIRAGGEDGEEYMGYSLYPEASYFNHSCLPNISKVRVGRTWQFRTAREVVEGEELCITYLGGDEKDLTVGERRQRLKGVWGFECMCERCRNES
jgi:SET and MYND domain-containing protein